MKRISRAGSIEDRFERSYEPVPFSGCWLWIGSVTEDGYGKIIVDGARVRAHRLAYQLFVGQIPDGAHVLHRCDVPICVNPQHLFIGSQTDNMLDMTLKGRRRTGWHNKVKTHCIRGHPLFGDNVVVTPKGHRYCKACRPIQAALREAKENDIV